MQHWTVRGWKRDFFLNYKTFPRTNCCFPNPHCLIKIHIWPDKSVTSSCFLKCKVGLTSLQLLNLLVFHDKYEEKNRREICSALSFRWDPLLNLTLRLVKATSEEIVISTSSLTKPLSTREILKAVAPLSFTQGKFRWKPARVRLRKVFRGPSREVLGRSLGCCTCCDIITRALQWALHPPSSPHKVYQMSNATPLPPPCPPMVNFWKIIEAPRKWLHVSSCFI